MTDDRSAFQAFLPFDDTSGITESRQADSVDMTSPWFKVALARYLQVKAAHEAPPEDRETRIFRLQSAYEEWVVSNSKIHPSFDPEYPSPAQDDALWEAQLDVDPRGMSVEWAYRLLTMTKAEYAALLRTGLYGDLTEEKIQAMLTSPEHAWRAEGSPQEPQADSPGA
jgi:hypothetical protein